jgi:hypothetical protein
VHLGVWNADCSKRLNRLIEDLRRMTGVPVQYFRAAEVQDRGALHFHLILRMPKSRGLVMTTKALRELALKHGFGHEAKLDPVDNGRAASYVAKYVSKACAERASMPWVDRRTGEVCPGNGRYRVWTSSRKWGLTMAGLRAEQAAWWATKQALAAGDPAGAGCRPAGPGPAAAGPLDLNSQSYATGQLSLLEGVGL